MKPQFFALLLLVAVALIPGSVVAQTDGPDVEVSVGNDSAESDSDPAREWIDNLTAIENARVSDGRMILTLHSKISQRVTITDAGAVFKGGRVPRKTVYLNSGKNRVTIPVTEVSGQSAVTISTRNVLYAKKVRTSSTLIGGPWDYSDTQAAALGGGIGSAVVVLLLTLRTIYGRESGIERVA